MTAPKRKKNTIVSGLTMPQDIADEPPRTSTKQAAKIPRNKTSRGKEIKSHLGKTAKSDIFRRVLFEQTNDAIAIIDKNYKVIKANENFAVLLGYTLVETLQLFQWDWSFEQTVQENPLVQWRGLSTIPTVLETRFRRKDGSIFEVEVSYTSANLEDQEVLFLVCREITERKRMEVTLAQSESAYRTLFENVPVSIYRTSADGRILDANPTMIKMFGYQDRKSFLALKAANLYADPVTDKRFFEEMTKSDGITIMEAEFRKMDSATFWAEDHVRAIYDETGSLLFYEGSLIDITERRQAETALRESEQRFKLASWATKDVIWERDLLTNTILWNESLRKLSRYPVGEIDPTVDWWQDHIHPVERIKVIGSIQTAIEQGEDFWSKEYRFRLFDGSYADIFDRGYIVYDGQGRPIRMIGVMMDITERKEAEEHLEAERNLLSTLIDNLPDCIFVKDLNSSLVLDNIAHRRLLGATILEEVVGKTDFDFFPRDLAASYFADEEKIIQTGESLINQEEPVIDREGNQKWLLTTKVPLKDRQGTITGIVGINHDITDRRLAEDALKQEHAYLEERTSELRVALRETEELFSTVQDMLTSTHLKKICQSLITHFVDLVKADHITLYLVDHQRQEILLNLATGEFRDLAPLTYQELNDGIVGQVFKSGQPVLSLSTDIGVDPPPSARHEHRIRDDVGSSITIPLLTREGTGILRVIGVVIVANHLGQSSFSQHDKSLLMTMATQAAIAIENVRLYEEAQRARDEANAANKSKSEFLANMSHEIRTPMNAILGLTQLVLDMELDESQRNYLQKIQTSSKALLAILNDILDYSKIEAGKLSLEEVDFNLEEILHNTAELFSLGAEEKEIELIFEIAQDVPLILKGDPLRLGQVFNNLVGNAIKFTERGEIQLNVSLDRVENETAWLHFSVRDTGIGITKEQMEQLFHAFSQADTSTTRKFGGTGLGLTICKNLIEMMGGKIDVESSEGEGSVFFFSVPLRLVSNLMPMRQVGELRGMKTLIVDDQDTSLQVMKKLLNSWSFDVTLASSGEEGLREVIKAVQSGHPFELLLIDWKMPGLGGLELTNRIWELRPQIGLQPLVIMVTAFSRDDVLRSADAIHLDAVLEKPITPSPLFDILVNLQKGKAANFQGVSSLDWFEATRPIHGAHILVVEDNSTNQLVARGFLEKMGLVVEIAQDGQEALDKIDSNTYDLVLMDLQMPRMDGFEAARRIRSMKKNHDLPIIAMTAAVMQKDRDASNTAGMNGHIAKPINVEELISTLTTWIPHHGRGGEILPFQADSMVHTGRLMFKSTPDFDLNITLGWLEGDQASLKKIITFFEADLKKISYELHEASEKEDWVAVKSMAHKLNGTAGNIGAIALQREAAEVESELMKRSNTDTAALEERLEQALEYCKHFLAEMTDDQAQGVSANLDEINRSLDELTAILQHNRLIPAGLLKKIRDAQTWGASNDLLEKLEHQSDLFQYKEALVTLELIRKELELKE